MIREFKVSVIREGMKFDKPVYIDDQNLWLTENTPIQKKDLQFLDNMGIDKVYSDGDISFDNTEKTEDKKQPEGVRNEDDLLKNIIEEIENGSDASLSKAGDPGKLLECAASLGNIFGDIANKRPVKIRQLYHATNEIQNFVKANKQQSLSFILGDPACENTTEKCAIDICILSILIAAEMKLDEQKINETSAAALLHDVGMLRLPKETLAKKGKLSDAEIQLIQTHTLYSYHIVRQELKYPESVALLTMNHHEHWDGTGYPHHLSGRNILVGARIITVADSFLAMVTEKPYRNSMLAYEAMKALVAENSRHFSPDVLAAFVKIMGVYPISSNILLNDGRIAKVIKLKKEAPLRPVIRIVKDKHGQPVINGEEIKLYENKHLYIIRVVSRK